MAGKGQVPFVLLAPDKMRASGWLAQRRQKLGPMIPMIATSHKQVWPLVKGYRGGVLWVLGEQTEYDPELPAVLHQAARRQWIVQFDVLGQIKVTADETQLGRGI